MTASASAWQPAISYSLTGALVLLVVASSTPPDSAVHQTLPADVCVVTWRSPAHVDVECCLFNHGNMLSVFLLLKARDYFPRLPKRTIESQNVYTGMEEAMT